LQELVSHQLCRESNLHKDNDGWANCRPLSADLFYTTLDTWWAQLLVIGSGQFQDKQPREPNSEPTTENLLLENSNTAPLERIYFGIIDENIIELLNC
jgi:hypothetical protein